METKNGTIYLSQVELAELIGVSRTTISAWQRESMPFEPQGRGKASRYIAPVAVNWYQGREAIRKMGLKLTDPKLTVLFGHSIGMGGEPGWKRTARSLAEKMNVTGEEFIRLFAMCEGIRLARGIR